jgi:enamine deaminase RidA (YjgF/YER057c/UK114 family)
MVATLEGSGSSIDKIVDVQCFLIDMKRDFTTFNKVLLLVHDHITFNTLCIVFLLTLPSPDNIYEAAYCSTYCVFIFNCVAP